MAAGGPPALVGPFAWRILTLVDQWYYARDSYKLGPFSGRELRDLAVCGLIVPTDTVWKAGTKQGVAAGNLKHLFPSQEAQPRPGAALGRTTGQVATESAHQ